MVNLIATKENSPGDQLLYSPREWSSMPECENDIPVEIWYNNNWVPAYFKDIKAGDFFMSLDSKLDPDRCFRAGSDVIRSPMQRNGMYSYIIKGNIEVVQAPSAVLKDLPVIETETRKLK